MLEGSKQGSCLNAIGQVITAADNKTLMAPYSELEITNALFSRWGGAAFFQKYWHIVGQRLVQLVY